MKLLLTAQIEPLCDDPLLQPFHITDTLGGVAKRMAGLSNSKVELSQLSLDSSTFESRSDLVTRVRWHYSLQATLQRPRACLWPSVARPAPGRARDRAGLGGAVHS